jgi:hypothetical protein
MFEIALFIYFCVMTLRINKMFKREADIPQEFRLPKPFKLYIFLFPLGPIIYWSASYALGWLIALPAAAACYAPALFSARRCLNTLEQAGTDRANDAKNLAEQILTTSIVGLVYVGIRLIFALLATGMSVS